MRIRTQLIASAVVAVALTAAIVAGLFHVTRQAQAGLDAQAVSQQVARDLANMLSLTNEFAVYGGERAVQQWRARVDQLRATVAQAARQTQPPPELLSLQHDVDDLPALFDALVRLGARPPDELGQRRRELLLERLLTETQEVVETRHRWAVRLGQAQQRDQHLYTGMVLAAPAALMALWASLGVLVSRRVLRPLARLERAVTAMRAGDLTVRCASSTQDELGDAARAVDEMARALQQQSAALKASEHQLRLLADNLPAAVEHLDSAQRYTFVNAAGAADPAQRQALLGRTLLEVRGETLHRELAPQVARVLGGEAIAFESTSGGADSPLHQQTTFVPDVDDAGQVRGFYAMTFDITARKQAELRQAASEQRLIDLINNLPAMVGYYDMQERCLYANDTALESQGIERGDLPGLTLRGSLGETAYAQHEPSVREVLMGRRSRVESKLPFQGREAHFQSHFIPDRVDGGLQRGFYVMTFDITALKEAQQRQAQVERQLRRVSDNLPVLISYLDREERYVFANATFRDWLGVDPATLVGRRMVDVALPEHYRQRQPFLRRALDGERVEFDIESEMLGVVRSLKISYVPDVQPDGSVAGIYTLSSDVSALKAIERQLELLARADTLTGLPNRRHFEERLAHAVARSARSKRPMALMFLDVDHFKSINDRMGHAAGDAVLREFGARLKAAVRATDLAARLAGDEFVVLIEELGGEREAEHVAHKVISTMRSPFLIEGSALHVTTSVGVAYCERPVSDADVMARADEALYRAKAAGRDTFKVSAFDALRH